MNYSDGIRAGRASGSLWSPCAPPRPLKVITLEFFLLILGLAVGGALGFNYGRKSRPTVQLQTAGDAIVTLIRVVHQKYGSVASMQVKGVALDTFRGPMRDHMEAQLDQDPLP